MADVVGSPGAGEGPVLETIDELLFPERATYDAAEIAARSGVDPKLATDLWRAMGFTMAPPGERIFGPEDLEALALARDAGAQVDPGAIIYRTRVVAASLARIAEIDSDAIAASVDQLRRAGTAESDIAAAIRHAGLPDDIDLLGGYFYRRQLRAALWRKLAGTERGDDERGGGDAGVPHRSTSAVGFVDLVRFTAVTEGIAEEELGEMITRFEDIAHDRVTARGGRIVKTIGDEVMFVADDPADAVGIAFDLVEGFGADTGVPPARAGLAWGPVLPHGGDVFGPVVNLAARVVGVARPSTVVVSEALRTALAGRPDLRWRRLPPRRLKGLGRVVTWRVERAGGG